MVENFNKFGQIKNYCRGDYMGDGDGFDPWGDLD